VQSHLHSRNKVFLIQYHLVWCPKRRKSVLVGKVKERLEQIIYQVADELGIKVLAINPDHLFISAYPTIPVHKIVRRIKGRSSNVLRKEFPELLNHYGLTATMFQR